MTSPLVAKRVLITGATGYLGSKLAGYLVERGWEIVVLKRRASRMDRLRGLPCVAYDVENLDLTHPFVGSGPIGAVVHCATCYGRSGEPQSWLVETNTLFPLRVMEAASDAGTSLFINVDTALDPAINGYSLSKSHFADWGRQFAAKKKLRFVNVRLEHLYGPGDDPPKFPAALFRACVTGGATFDLTLGVQRRDFIHIDDVLPALGLLLDVAADQSAYFQEYPLGTGQPVTVREFAQAVKVATGACTELRFGAVPYGDNEVMYSAADTTPLRALGWRPRLDLAEGLRRTALEEHQQ